MPILDDDSRAAILGLLMDPDLTYAEIAEATGWSEHTVANVAAAAGIKRGKGPHRSPLRDRLHEVAGLSNAEAAKKLGVSRQRVSKLRKGSSETASEPRGVSDVHHGPNVPPLTNPRHEATLSA